MHRINPRAVLAVVALAAGTLVLPVLTQPAAATPTIDYHVVLADTDRDGSSGIYRRVTGDSTNVPLVAETPVDAPVAVDISALTTSADGSRFAYILDTFDAEGNTTHSMVVVRDISGRLVRVAEDFNVTGTFNEDLSPALSPDGSTVVWMHLTFTPPSTLTTVLRRAPVASGAATNISGSSLFGDAEFLNAGTLIGNTSGGVARTLPLAGGTATAVVGLAESNTFGFAVSPSGAQLSWAHDTTAGDLSTVDVKTGDLALSGSTATVSNTVVFATGLDNESPSFSADGLELSFVRYDGGIGPGDVLTGPVDQGTPTAPVADPATTGDELLVSRGGGDGVSPGAAMVATPFTLAGTAATVRWTNPADTDLSGVVVTRTATGLATVTTYVPAPLATLAQTGLVLGKTHTYAIRAVDRSGNQAATATRSLTALAATAAFADPTSTLFKTAPFSVRVGAGAASTARYTVKYRANGGTETPWLTDVAPGVRIFGAATGPGVTATAPVAGNSYLFRIVGTDGALGNSTVDTAGGTAVVPYDQTRAAFSSGVVTSSPDRWYGSARVLQAAASYAKLTVVGNRFQLIGERCTTCGVFDVFDNNHLVGSVDSRGTRAPRAVLFTRTLTAGSHVMVVKNRGTAGRSNVIVDGFAVRR